MEMTRLWSAFRRPGAPRIVALRSELAEQCAPLHAKSFLHSWTAPEFEALLSSGSVEGTAAIDGRSDELWGFVLSRRAADEAEILTIAVDPAMRGRGVGRILMRDHLSRLMRLGTVTLFLEVERGNAPALALYARLGFREVGERPGYYRTAGRQRRGGRDAPRLGVIILRLLAVAIVGLLIIGLGGPPRAFAQARGWSFGQRMPVALHRFILFCLGVRLRVHGAPCSLTPQLVVVNHVSWLDIVVLGAMRRSEFLAKKEVGPPGLIGAAVALQGVVFVDRGRRRLIPKVNAAMARRMRAGAPLVLFAEATTGDGNRLLPFRSSHFEALRMTLDRSEAGPGVAYVQPLYLAYSRRGGLPIGRPLRPLVAWYGDMEFFSHLMDFMRAGRFDCDIWCGAAIAHDGSDDRKALMRRAEASVRALATTAFREGAPRG